MASRKSVVVIKSLFLSMHIINHYVIAIYTKASNDEFFNHQAIARRML